MARSAEFFSDPGAPAAVGLVTSAFAAVRDDRDRLLLVRRTDDGNWELPGGRVDVGETVARAAVREVAEEAGVRVKIVGLAGVYSDPSHVLVYPGEGALQQVAICFHARPEVDRAAPARPDGVETSAARWFEPEDVGSLVMHPAVRRRVRDVLEGVVSAAFE